MPSLRAFLYEAARSVADPKGRGTVYDVWSAPARERTSRGYGVVAGAGHDDPPVLVLGSGSDYTVFFNHLGIPSVDFMFDGPYGVYHSSTTRTPGCARRAIPGFAYHAAMARLWGVMALRLANAEVLPFDYAAYGRDLSCTSTTSRSGRSARQRAARPRGGARAAAERWPRCPRPPRPRARTRSPSTAALMRAERDLLAPEGIPGRPWFRHLVYAPLPSYEAETLPGVREAVEAGDGARARQQAELLARAIARAVETLSVTVPAPPDADRPRD